ncbi:MAG: hypothetical protein H6840_09430 [Planctomycetes bacterium]|nr:hypothetical protein [Planctomycetota bacterium]
MQPTATRQRATRTVKIGDNHHRLLRILASFTKLSLQEAVEFAVEQALCDYLDGSVIVPEPTRDWAKPDSPATQAA